jgi:O-antigen/teichoic acid export membrane protein
VATEAIRLVDPARGDLEQRVARGYAWKFLSQLTTQGARTIVTIILARLLGPGDFGLAAMVLVLTAFVTPLCDLGLGIALVQRRTINELDRSTVFWTSVAAGAVFTGVGIAAAPLVADFYHESAVAPLFAVLALSFVIAGAGSTQRSLLARAMDFRTLEIRLMFGVVVGAVVGVSLAVMGFGAWALIGQQLGAVVASTLLLWCLTGWRPKMMFSWRAARSLGAFGGRHVAGSTFLALNQNVDNLLVGRALGSAALGAYGLAYSVILVPLSRIVYPFQQVLAPAFSRLQDDKHSLAEQWLRTTRLLAILCLPLTLTASVNANDFVAVLFGAKWEAAVPVVEILALVCAIQCVHGLHNQVLEGLGKMRTFLWVSALSFAMNLTAFLIGLHWGIVGVAAAFGVSTALYYVGYTVVVARIVEIPAARFWVNLSGVTQAAVALVIAELGARAALTELGSAGVIRLLGCVTAGVIVFIPACLWRNPDVRPYARRLAAKVSRRKVAALPELST